MKHVPGRPLILWSLSGTCNSEADSNENVGLQSRTSPPLTELCSGLLLTAAEVRRLLGNTKQSLSALTTHLHCERSHHRSSICGGQCALSCDWRSTPADRVGRSGRTLARHLAAAEPEATGADTHSHNPQGRSQRQTYNKEMHTQPYEDPKKCTNRVSVNLTLAGTWPVFERAGRQRDRRTRGANRALNSECWDSSTPNRK